MVIWGIKLTGKQPAATELTRRDHSTDLLVVTITVTCYLRATTSGDRLFHHLNLNNS